MLLDSLNPSQLDAVKHTDGPLLILAGAGSGKTRVLTHRIAHILDEGLAGPDEILAITFTNKAASEMKERVALLVGPESRKMWVSTFHAFCARILRVHAEKLGYKREFTIYDSADQVRLVKRCIVELGKDPKRFNPRSFQSQISDAKNKLMSADDYLRATEGYMAENVAEAYNLYQQRLYENNAMDFDDLIMQTVALLELFPEVRERYQRRFKYIHVDEYQDTNHAQYRLVTVLAEAHHNLCVVGDDDQCLIEGTMVRMEDGSEKRIEDIAVDDEVSSGFGSGDFRPARVSSTVRRGSVNGVRIVTESGREIISTPEHTHFAGYCGMLGASVAPSSSRPTAVAERGIAREAVGLVEGVFEWGNESRIARLGSGGEALPFMTAESVEAGMVMFTGDGEYDVVESVERVILDRPVYDLDIEGTHNFVANGVVTHNSVYSWRGATSETSSTSSETIRRRRS
jgi:DNA helicase-2/ATP-dependent DNA helicase PcrA